MPELTLKGVFFLARNQSVLNILRLCQQTHFVPRIRGWTFMQESAILNFPNKLVTNKLELLWRGGYENLQ